VDRFVKRTVQCLPGTFSDGSHELDVAVSAVRRVLDFSEEQLAKTVNESVSLDFIDMPTNQLHDPHIILHTTRRKREREAEEHQKAMLDRINNTYKGDCDKIHRGGEHWLVCECGTYRVCTDRKKDKRTVAKYDQHCKTAHKKPAKIAKKA
jgi:hypothetical protein